MRRKDFDIAFSGLSLGEHQYCFELNDAFFELFGYEDHSQLQGVVEITLEKHNTFLELRFSLSGEVQVECDRSGEPFMQHLRNEFTLLVKFGEAYNDDDDETLIVPQDEYKVNVAQYIYELVVLAIPQKNIHPDVKSGKIEIDIPEAEEPVEEENIDPRWDKLKDLLN